VGLESILGSVPWSAIANVIPSMPECVLENAPGGVLGSILAVYIKAYMGACDEVHEGVVLYAT